MRILFLGAGATGGYFGGRLMEAGADVTFQVRPRRMEQLRENGLVVHSPFGNIRLPAQTIGKARSGYDLIVLTSKAYDLEDAIESIRPAVGPDTVVMPLLNGLNHMDMLDAAFGKDRVMGGLCHIPITMEPDGTIRHLNPIHRLRFDIRAPNHRPVVDALAAAYAKTVVDWKVSENIMQDLWDKFTFLATLAAGTCLMRATVGSITSQPGGPEFMRALYEECRATAAAEGFAPSDAVNEDSLRQLIDPGGTMAASMSRDVARGNRVEGEHIVGDMVRRAAAHGIPTPNLSVALLHLRAYEAERQKKLAAG